MQLGVASELGCDWLGARVARGPFMGLYCEDDRDELHRRFDKVAAHYGSSLAALNDVHVRSLVDEDAILATPDQYGIVRPTALFDRLLAEAVQIRPRIVTIDTAADVFGGSEINRAHVRQFIGLLRRLALATGVSTAVILTAHPSLTGLSTGTGLSGSTGWNATVRSRLYFTTPKATGGEPVDTDERELQLMKSNYGPKGETISLRWKNGVFVPTSTVHWIDRRAADNAADDLFLKLLDQFDRQGRNTSHKPSAPGSYAPALFAKDPDAKTKGIRKEALAEAMNRLFKANKVHVATYGRPSRPSEKLALGARP
jgi:RecA-family ATPase